MNQFDAIFESDWLEWKLSFIKDAYKGARCFIVGNGPSLAYTPLEQLQGEFCLAMNKIADIYPHTPWRPDFYMNVSNAPLTFPPLREPARIAVRESAISFLHVEHLPVLFGVENEECVVPHTVIPVQATFKHYYPKIDPGAWSFDIQKSVSKDGSSMFAALQIAVYMGFNPLILIGCDLGFVADDWESGIDPNHFSKSYLSGLEKHGEPYRMTESYARNTNNHMTAGHRSAKRVCDAIGVKIYNATLGGELEVHPRVDFARIVKGG